jgi:hypothetical protein
MSFKARLSYNAFTRAMQRLYSEPRGVTQLEMPGLPKAAALSLFMAASLIGL